MRRDLYVDVTARILRELERGAAPWVKPWSQTPGMNHPHNAATGRPYSGCNVVLLWMAAKAGYSTPRYLTFKQALELGGNVRRGEPTRLPVGQSSLTISAKKFTRKFTLTAIPVCACDAMLLMPFLREG